jgi:hypothetical protein
LKHKGIEQAQLPLENEAPPVCHTCSRWNLAEYLGLLQASEDCLLRGWAALREAHPTTPDVGQQSALFAGWSRENLAALAPYAGTYGARQEGEPEALARVLAVGRPQSGFGLMRDLQALWLMANESFVSTTVLIQGARALGDRDLEKSLREIENRNDRQRTWLMARLRQAAPQTLAVPS